MSSIAIVTGASGQDGYFLISRLLADGLEVHATVRTAAGAEELRRLRDSDLLKVHVVDLRAPKLLNALIAEVQPDEFYNLAGQSSVSASFADPSETWRTNAEPVSAILEALRLHSPATRFYQSSSSEMFGSAPGQSPVRDEDSPLRPQSPYAAAKAAAHVMCDAYRHAYGMRIACGILFNHESRRRPPGFLTRKVVDHVRRVRLLSEADLRRVPPLPVGNLSAKRDWGFAPDYVDGIVRIGRQIVVRAQTSGTSPEIDSGANYRNYVLGSGQLHAVWELIDRAFELAELALDWDRQAEDPARWVAHIRRTGSVAIVVDPDLIRPADPQAILANAGRARLELGWAPQPGLDAFLLDMLDA